MPAVVELAQQRHHPGAGDRVEVAGRLVGEQQRRVAGHRAGDGDPLAFAAGELVRAVREPVAEADPDQGRLGAPLPLLLRQRRRRAGRRRRWPRASRPGARWNCWNTKPIRRARSADSCRSDSVATSWPSIRTVPAGRPVERADQVQHRGLAGAGRADDRHQFAVLDGQVDRAYGGDPAGIALGDAGQLDHLVAHTGIPTFMPAARPSPVISTWPSANRPVSTATIRVAAPSTTCTP